MNKIIIIAYKQFPPEYQFADDKRIINYIYLFKKLGFQITIIGINEHEIRGKFEGISYITINSGRSKIRKIIFSVKVANLIKKNIKNPKKDIVLINSQYGALTALLLKKYIPQVKIIYDIMGISSKELFWDQNKQQGIIKKLKSKFFYNNEKILYDKADTIITINKLHKNQLKKNIHKEVHIFPDFYNKTIKNNPNKSILTQKPIIFFMGSFARNRLFPLLSSARKLKSSGHKFKIILAGNGPDYKKYEKFIKENKLEEVKLIGYKSEEKLDKLIKLADICYSDAYLIGFPFKAFQYAAYGKPILIEENGSVKEILGSAAVTYKGDADLTSKLSDLIKSKTYRDKLSTLVFKRYLKFHTPKIRIEQLKNIIYSKK